MKKLFTNLLNSDPGITLRDLPDIVASRKRAFENRGNHKVLSINWELYEKYLELKLLSRTK